MAYQETTRTSYGSKVKNSFQGILWGIILIIAGTVILWWNEGRAVKASNALKDFQKNYVELSDISKVDPEFEGKAIHASGVATTADTLRDAAFGIAVNAMKLARSVEYYQWTQHSESESKDKLGGSTETTTTYTYEPAWCSSPVNSNDFKDPDYKGKNFVHRVVDEQEQLASNVSFGAYRLTPSIVGRISGEEPAYPALTEAQMKQLLANVADTTVTVTVSGDQVYIGANPATPHIGDVRITFTQVTSPKTISLLQKVVNGSFESYVAKNGKQFSKVEMGTVSAANMIENQKSANKMMLWLLRIVGIIIVLAGFRSLVSFISTVFAVVPFVQRIIGTGTGLVATIVGLVWSFVVIALAWVAHRPVLGIALLVAAAALIYWLVSRSRKKKTADVAALLVICLMIGISSCTGTKTPGGDSNAASPVVKGPVKTVVETEFYGEGIPSTTTYEYDLKGKLVSEKTTSWDEEEEDYGILESLSEKDAEGRYLKEVWGALSTQEVTNYTVCEYDEAGRSVLREYHDASGSISSTERYRHDASGRLILTTTHSDYGDYATSYDYDDQGNIRKTTYSHNGQPTNITTYTYDEKGRQILSNEDMIAIGRNFKNYTSYDKDGETIGMTTVITEADGTSKVSTRDTFFVDRSGMQHQRTYHNFDDGEKTFEATFNKGHYITHYEYFEGNASQPAIIADFKYADDGATLLEADWKEYVLGQEKEHHHRSFTTKADTFGNWTMRTYGPSYIFDAQYVTLESLTDELGYMTREISYYGDDQGQNYGFEGKAGQAPVMLTCTEDHGVLFGEISIDGNKYRAVGRRDEEDAGLFFVALEKDGKIPWSLSIDDGEGKRSATLFKGNDEIAATLSPVRDGLKTYKFSTTPDEMVGIYEYVFADEIGSGRMDVSRGGENWEEINFDIFNVGRAPSRNMAKDSFSDAFGEDTVFYRYLWNEDNDAQFSYRIRFFDGFAVIVPDRGDPSDFFGFGTTIAGIYAKIPSVG